MPGRAECTTSAVPPGATSLGSWTFNAAVACTRPFTPLSLSRIRRAGRIGHSTRLQGSTMAREETAGAAEAGPAQNGARRSLRHELRTPIHHILGCSELLLDD